MAELEHRSWRKSSFSGNGGPNCVEVAGDGGMVLVRDTRHHGHGPVHRYSLAAWRAFVSALRTGQSEQDQPARP
jgi:hypothetical protein